jgi:hypothetical protein
LENSGGDGKNTTTERIYFFTLRKRMFIFSCMNTTPAKVEQQLKKIGENIRTARRRRRIMVRELAERLYVSLPTVRRLERGDPSVAAGTYLTALFVLELAQDQITNLADPAKDQFGMTVDLSELPQRIYRKKNEF